MYALYLNKNGCLKEDMQIGYSSRWMFLEDKETDIFEELDYAHSLGFEVFGLNLDRKQNRMLTDKELIKLKNQAKQYHMKIIVRSPHHLNTAIKNKKLMSEVKRNIKIAKSVGSDRLMIHSGHIVNKLELDLKTSKSYKSKGRKEFNIPKKQIQERFRQLMSNLNEIVSLGKSSNIKIALENNGEYYQFGSNLKEYYELLTKVKDLKASISTGHANISGNNVYDYISQCRSKIINLDLHDNFGKKDEHLPVGDGNIDFGRVLKPFKNKKEVTLLIDTYTNVLIKKSLLNLREVLKTL